MNRRRSITEVIDLLPSDDQIWTGRRRTWPQWEKATTLPRKTLKVHFHRRGFMRQSHGPGHIHRAPCKGCRLRFSIQELNSERECRRCAPMSEATTYADELAAYLERHPTGSCAELRRPYTPGARTRPKAPPAPLAGGPHAGID